MEYEINILEFLESFVFIAIIWCFNVFKIILSLLDFNSITSFKYI